MNSKLLRYIILTVGMTTLVVGFQNFSSGSSQKIQREGTLEVLHIHNADKSSRYEYSLIDKSGKKIKLKFNKGKAPDLVTGARIRVSGEESNNVLALDDGGSSSLQVLAAPAPNTFGEQKTLVMLVNFTDNTTQPFTVDQATTTVFGDASNFMRENSFGQTWLAGKVVGWYTLPIVQTCSPDNIALYANQAATSAGVDLSLYVRRIYVFPRNSACWTGLGTVGGNPSSAWINGFPYRGIVSHEVGHNLGLWHSHSLDCGATTLGSSCSQSEYGDAFDTMGSGGGTHYNSFQKERLGWLNFNVSPAIQTVTASGTYMLEVYSTASNGGIKALKILKSTDSITGLKTWYYVEFRQPIGFDSDISRFPWAVNGVIVRTGSESSGDTSLLLDMTPNSSSVDDISDSPLMVGNSYTDSTAGVTISLLSVSSSGASVSVSVSGGGGQVCAFANPTLSISPAAGPIVAPGTPVSYTFTLKNNNNSSCPSSTFNLQLSTPPGFVVTGDSSSMTLASGASASKVITWTSPTTAIAGTYNLGVYATNSSNTAFGGSVGATYSVATVATCTRANPSVALSPSTSASVAPGTAVSYAISVKNNDSSGCAASIFNLAKVVPSGWSSSLSSSSLSLSPGASGSATLTVTSSTTAVAGSYSISTSAVNGSATSYSGSASASYSVASVASLSASVVTNKSTYLKGDSVVITAGVSSGGVAVSGASVNFAITKPDGSIVNASAVTDASGKAVYKMRLSRKASAGTYQVLINATSGGQSASASTSFGVQ